MTLIEAASGLMEMQVWATYRPANARGYEGPAYALGIAHANTGGQDASGTLPIPSGGSSNAAGTLGTVFDGIVANGEFDNIVTTLVNRNIVDILRTDAVVMQPGAWLPATHVKGTRDFRYAAFPDLGVAELLLEGVPPQTSKLAWEILTFTGGQKGKLVAITDLAEIYSPFELYSIAAEKLAWNAVDTAEKDIVTLLMAATGVSIVMGGATIAANVVNTTVGLKQAEVPRFPDGTYQALVSPGDAGLLMTELTGDGWTEASKYTDSQVGKLLTGEVGKFRGIRFIESNRITDGKAVVYGPGYFIHGDFQTIRSYRVAPGGNHADPLAQRGLVGWKGMWGQKLVEFDGSPAVGPASNTKGFRFTVVDLTAIS